MLFPSDDGKTELCGGIWGFGIFDNGVLWRICRISCMFCIGEGTAIKVIDDRSCTPVRPTLTGIYDGMETAETMDMFSTYFMPSMGDYYQVVPGWAEARTEWWNMLQRIGTFHSSA